MSTHEDLVLLIRIQRTLNKLDNMVKPLRNVGVHVVADRDVHDRHMISKIPAHICLDGGHDVRDPEPLQIARCSGCEEIREVQTRGDGSDNAAVHIVCIVPWTPIHPLSEGVLPAGGRKGHHGTTVGTRTLPRIYSLPFLREGPLSLGSSRLHSRTATCPAHKQQSTASSAR